MSKEELTEKDKLMTNKEELMSKQELMTKVVWGQNNI